MKKDKIDQNVKKYEHECRKYRPAFEKMKLAINDKNISSKDYFNTCFKYDLLDSFQAVAGTALGFTNGTQFCGFFIRKFLEAYAVLFADKENQFEETNYKLFKIMSQNREIGKRESDKLKKQFKIKSSKNLQDIYADNPYMYLLGATDNKTTPFELLRNIETESLEEAQEKDKILENYRFTSCLIHYIHEFNLSDCVLKPIDEMYKAELKAIKTYLKKDLDNNGKLGDPTKLNDIFDFHYKDMEIELLGTSLRMLTLFTENKQSSVLIPAIAYFTNTILTLNFWFVRKEYSYIMCVPKMLFEKIHLYFHLINLENYKEMEVRSLSYSFIVENKISLKHDSFVDDEEIDQKIHQIYDAFKKYCNLKLNYYDFKKFATDQPAFLVYSKDRNYTDLANVCISMLQESYDKDELFSLYKESVDYSHSLGNMIFKNEEEYFLKAKTIASIVFSSYKKYLTIMKNHPIIKLDDNQKEIVSYIDKIESLINDFEKLYKTVSK